MSRALRARAMKDNEMKRWSVMLAACALLSMAGIFAAHARPPTVVTSPGYDARLAESRKALQAQPVPRPARQRAPKPKFSAADKAWIDTCIAQRKASNARPAAMRNYCTCMHDVVENNQPFGITELERTYPPVHEGCWSKYRMR